MVFWKSCGMAALVFACAGCAGVDREKSAELGYDYRPWRVDTALDRLCLIPGAISGNGDSPAQRGMRLLRAGMVEAAIFHYGVSRVERYSDNPQADAAALLVSAGQAFAALHEAWGKRDDPRLYEVGKADIVDATASMAARALEPTSDKLRSYFLSPRDLDAAGDLIVGAIQVALYEQAYENDCNRLMRGLGEQPDAAALAAVGEVIGGQIVALCARGAALTGLDASGLCRSAEALRAGFSVRP